MIKSRRTLRRTTSEATTIILRAPELTSTPKEITNSFDECSIQISVGEADCYWVSKYVLAEVPWFRDFLSREPSSTRYHLPDDNPLAIRILFSILHHQLGLLPISLLSSDLVHLATLCNKYDVTDIVVPHVDARKWVDNLWEHGKPYGRDWQRWVWILAGLSHREKRCQKLCTVLDMIAANMHLEEDEWIFECNNEICHVLNIDHPQYTVKDLSLHLQWRRQTLWDSFHRACAHLQDKQLKSNCGYSDIGKLYKFRQTLPSEVPPSVTVLEQLTTLRVCPWQTVADLDMLLTDHLEHFNAGF